MASPFTALIHHDGDRYIGWVAELGGVFAQEETRDALLASLSEALAEALEFARADARKSAPTEFTTVPLGQSPSQDR